MPVISKSANSTEACLNLSPRFYFIFWIQKKSFCNEPLIITASVFLPQSLFSWIYDRNYVDPDGMKKRAEWERKLLDLWIVNRDRYVEPS